MSAPSRRYDYAPSRNRRLPPDAYEELGSGVLITLRAAAGVPFAENGELCRAVIRLLAETRLQYGCWVGTYCLMPDHFHMACGPATEGASALIFADRFKGRTTRASWEYGSSGKLWQRRYHDHVLRGAESLSEIGEYILENPVRAGLVERPEDWPWSGVLDQCP